MPYIASMGIYVLKASAIKKLLTDHFPEVSLLSLTHTDMSLNCQVSQESCCQEALRKLKALDATHILDMGQVLLSAHLLACKQLCSQLHAIVCISAVSSLNQRPNQLLEFDALCTNKQNGSKVQAEYRQFLQIVIG